MTQAEPVIHDMEVVVPTDKDRALAKRNGVRYPAMIYRCRVTYKGAAMFVCAGSEAEFAMNLNTAKLHMGYSEVP